MPVNIIENWSDIVGEVIAIKPGTDLPGFSKVQMEVLIVEPVEGYPNLLENAINDRIEVLFPGDLQGELGIVKGSVVECRVRRAGGQRTYVHRDGITVRRIG